SDTVLNDVAEANAAPAISDIPDQRIPADGTTGPLPFTVNDSETPAGSLVVSATSSNTTLVPNGSPNIVLGGTGANRMITITPAASQQGLATIPVHVRAAANSRFTTFAVTVAD